MRIPGLVIGLIVLALATSGYGDCDPGGGGGGASGKRSCDGNCKVEIHLNSKCEPVSADGKSMMKTDVHPNSWVCFFNDADCTMRLNFPSQIFADGTTETTLAKGECVRLQIDKQFARKSASYTIACDCPDASGGGSGNPEFSGGGGGGGGGGG